LSWKVEPKIQPHTFVIVWVLNSPWGQKGSVVKTLLICPQIYCWRVELVDEFMVGEIIVPER